VPVVIGWSQGGLITGLLAASDPQHQVGCRVGLLSTARVALSYHKPYSGTCRGYYFPNIPEALAPTQSEIDEIIFGTDPITGKFNDFAGCIGIFSSPPFYSRIVSTRSWKK